MKKILSVFLAVLMLFGALSIGASALTAKEYAASDLVNANQVVLVFKFNGGKSYDPQHVYNPATNQFDCTLCCGINTINLSVCHPKCHR